MQAKSTPTQHRLYTARKLHRLQWLESRWSYWFWSPFGSGGPARTRSPVSGDALHDGKDVFFLLQVDGTMPTRKAGCSK
ncbi:hypothetical protein GH714_004653 [Hevea brasiliensis]|uniref:Uncharacterized protein n=1 Tax=Hevea brasiliensis TaxID=3981 RepID=A0A6A6MCM2_HEVBR|nr:hypothetical protein GH714_004653 [Hevea brasiliensis]